MNTHIYIMYLLASMTTFRIMVLITCVEIRLARLALFLLNGWFLVNSSTSRGWWFTDRETFVSIFHSTVRFENMLLSILKNMIPFFFLYSILSKIGGSPEIQVSWELLISYLGSLFPICKWPFSVFPCQR